jgi:hypothetical protein
MSKKKTFHRFNQNIDKEPQEVSTNVRVDTPKLETATFVVEKTLPAELHQPVFEPSVGLGELFAEIGSLLKEEPVNTNPYPSGPLPSERLAPAADPTPPLPVPADGVISNKAAPDPMVNATPVKTEDDEESANEQTSSQEPQTVQEAKIHELHAVADSITTATRATNPVVHTPPPPAVDIKPKKWTFKVIRNTQGLIDTIEATAS